MTRISSLPNLLARSGGGPQPAPFPTNTSCIRAFASELSPVVCPHILARNHPVRAEKPFAFNTPVAEQMLKHAHRPQTRARARPNGVTRCRLSTGRSMMAKRISGCLGRLEDVGAGLRARSRDLGRLRK